jgi:PAS domain S-box-containing protein
VVSGGGDAANRRRAEVDEATSLRRFLEMSIDLLAVLDLQTTILEASDSWRCTLGWDPVADLIGTLLTDYLHEDDLPQLEADLAGLLTGGEAAVTVEVRLRRADGTHGWLLGKASADLAAERIYLAAADVGGRRELEQRNEELERFAGAAAHDLKAPLSRIEMALAAVPVPEGEAGDLLQIARRGAGRLRQLIEDLLTFAAAGGRPGPPVRVDLDELLTEVLTDLDSMVTAAGARIDRGVLPPVWGHRAPLGQVLQNLIGNALKFARPAVTPVVTIEGRADETGTTLRIADNGVGIDQAQRNEVFGIFTRLRADEPLPGSGIGLATCAAVVAHHDGRIWIEDGIDGGVAVVVHLPPRRSTNPASASAGSPAPRPRG